MAKWDKKGTTKASGTIGVEKGNEIIGSSTDINHPNNQNWTSLKMSDADLTCPPQKAIINGISTNLERSVTLPPSPIFPEFKVELNPEMQLVFDYCQSEGILPLDLIECHKWVNRARRAAKNDNEVTLKEIDYLL